jgi:hypothetical protein
VIVVVGRPIARRGSGGIAPAGLAAEICLDAAARGAGVELVGTVGDDAKGDALAVGLARHGVGHAALLRVPAETPELGGSTSPTRLDARDVDLGLRYISECQVLVLAEPLPPEAEQVALEAARYHGAQVVAVVADGSTPSAALIEAGRVLQAPTEHGSAFAALIGRYSAALDAGTSADDAFATARREVGWEPGGA